MKDLFSSGSEAYAQFRPQYPQSLYDWLLSQVTTREKVWDCGTGSGQVACALAACFTKVYATDISQKQLENAVQKSNIFYSVNAAENSGFPANEFDLITVGQAIHWFDFDRFYAEVKRTLKPGGILAVIGYGLVRSNQEKINSLIDDLYTDILGKYWEPERKYIDENYRTLPFPFPEIEVPQLSMICSWSVEHFTGYLYTWSAVRNYMEKTGMDPLKTIYRELQSYRDTKTEIEFHFPVLLRAGKMD